MNASTNTASEDLSFRESKAASWIARAVEAVRQSTGIEGRIVPDSPDADEAVELIIGDQQHLYQCEVKRTIPRFAVLEDLKARNILDKSKLLVTASMTQEMAARCRTSGIQFIDTAGNAYLSNDHDLFVFVSGLKTAIDVLPIEATSLATPAALRMILGFLATPELLNASYREISYATKVATGAIGGVLNALAARNFLATTRNGRQLRNGSLLLSEWTAGYANRLRPKLARMRFSAEDPARLRAWQPTPGTAAWGGEMAAAMLTRHLKPQQLMIYLDQHVPGALNELVKSCRLRKDEHGELEVVQPFWQLDRLETTPGIAPLPLVYADLLASGESRNIDIASLLLKRMNNA